MTDLVFWTLGGTLTLAITVYVIGPLLRPRAGPDIREHSIAVYRDQLAELDRDHERGLIDGEQARAARVEIERRLLHAARAPGGAGARVDTRPLTALAVALLVGAGSLGVYVGIGSPGMPGQPLVARDQSALLEERERSARQLAELEEQVGENAPEAAEFWFALGRLRAELLGPEPAARAFREGLARHPENVVMMAALGETLVEQAEGTVTPAARTLFAAAVEREPDQPQALFYLGMAAAQEGDEALAVRHWGHLLATGPADAPWRPSVEQQYREAAEREGLDADRLIAERPGAAPSAAGIPADMSEIEREAMIRSMVDGLEARLADAPDDVEGWLSLGRSRLVLGETEAAIDAFAEARSRAPENEAAVLGEAEARLAAAERVQGVPIVSETLSELLRQVAEQQPDNPQPHWYLGLHAVQQGQFEIARLSWQRVLDLLGPDDPSYAPVQEQIEALPGSGG